MKAVDPRQSKSKNLPKLLGITIIITLFLTVFSTVLYQTSKSTMAAEMGRAAQGGANAAALTIMEDIAAFREQAGSGDTSTEYYLAMQAYFRSVIGTSNVRGIYAEIRLNSEEAVRVLNSQPDDGRHFSPPGSVVAVAGPRYEAYVTKQPKSTELIQDKQDGQWVEAFAPILGADGTALGLVGVEVSADPLFVQLNNRLSWTVLVCIVAFSLAVFFVISIAPDVAALVVRDELTGAYNKRYFRRYLSRQMQKARRTGSALSVLTIDVDHLGDINAKYGRSLGDLALRYFAMRVMNTLRKSDRCARYGGGTFMVALPNTSAGMAGRVGERIRHIAETYKIQQISAQHSVNITVSVGAAGMGSHPSATQLLADAELAMRTAKERRNAVAVLEHGALSILES